MDDDKTPYTISAELKPTEMDKTFAVPEPVKETVCSGKTESETAISEDLFQLFSAWTDMNQEESFTANVTLGVECSPISLNENMKYERTMVDGKKIGCIRKNNLAVYFADGIFCDQSARSPDPPWSSASKSGEGGMEKTDAAHGPLGGENDRSGI